MGLIFYCLPGFLNWFSSQKLGEHLPRPSQRPMIYVDKMRSTRFFQRSHAIVTHDYREKLKELSLLHMSDHPEERDYCWFWGEIKRLSLGFSFEKTFCFDGHSNRICYNIVSIYMIQHPPICLVVCLPIW